MKSIAIPIGALVLLAAGSIGGWHVWREVQDERKFTSPPEYTPDMKVATEANNRFALDLYAKLVEQKKGNLFYSPYSVHAALAMTATGARGNTQAEMRNVLHLPDDRMLYSAGDLGKFYAHPRRDFELSVANAIWGQKGHGWRPEWLALQSQRFASELQEADFRGNANTERLRINQWVEEQTRKRITNLLEPNDVTGSTIQVLVNAIYFKGKWATQFDPRRTRDQLFHLADDTRIKAPMMYGEVKCGYGKDKDVKLVELPYKGDELTMIVILPKRPDGVPALEKQLNPETLARWIALLKERNEFEVTLPRFQLQQRCHLVETLESLGM